MSSRLLVGQPAPLQELRTTGGIVIPSPGRLELIHLQLRRFAGCPVCSLHLHSVVARLDEIKKADIREVVVFHSTAAALETFVVQLPFDVVADPERRVYAAFGAESGYRALLDPRGWSAIFGGVARSLGQAIVGRARMPPLDPEGGRYGLPADFLIDHRMHIVALKYGEHVDDQWSVDELLRLASTHRSRSVCSFGIEA